MKIPTYEELVKSTLARSAHDLSADAVYAVFGITATARHVTAPKSAEVCRLCGANPPRSEGVCAECAHLRDCAECQHEKGVEL